MYAACDRLCDADEAGYASGGQAVCDRADVHGGGDGVVVYDPGFDGGHFLQLCLGALGVVPKVGGEGGGLFFL